MGTDLNSFVDKHLSAIANEKRDLAQHFIRCYIASRQSLADLGRLRGEQSLQSGYAEWLAKELFGLRPAPNPVQKGYDATDKKDGSKYQIKSRIVKPPNLRTSFDFNNIDEKFDYLLGLFFSHTFDLLGIIRVPYEVVRRLGNSTKTRFSFRWNTKMAKNSGIEKWFKLNQKV